MDDLQIEAIAAVAHEANRAWCDANEDYSQREWHESPTWQRDSAINGVKFHLDNPQAGPEASHENWLAEKLADGWIYGEIKDPENKLHPCMVPFNELPVFQQKKDTLFRSIVHALKD